MSNSSDALPELLPRPRHFEIHAGSFRLRDGVPIVLDESATDADFASACALRDALLRTHELQLPVETHVRHDDLGPRIELRYGAVKVADLDFEIELALKVKGVRREVRAGKVVCATAGVFSANARLSLHEQVLVVKKTPEFAAPATSRVA